MQLDRSHSLTAERIFAVDAAAAAAATISAPSQLRLHMNALMQGVEKPQRALHEATEENGGDESDSAAAAAAAAAANSDAPPAAAAPTQTTVAATELTAPSRQGELATDAAAMTHSPSPTAPAEERSDQPSVASVDAAAAAAPTAPAPAATAAVDSSPVPSESPAPTSSSPAPPPSPSPPPSDSSSSSVSNNALWASLPSELVLSSPTFTNATFLQKMLHEFPTLLPKNVAVPRQLYQLAYDFDSVFNEHNITYVIADGTLLGSMRHSGLIPWDDDIDTMVGEGKGGEEPRREREKGDEDRKSAV